jgi:hypothetical protein
VTGSPDNSADPGSTTPQPDSGTPPEAAAEAGVECNEPGAVSAGGNCYFALTTAVTWDDAKAACTAAKAHLVSITSAEEQTAVAAIQNGQSRWIGMRQKDGAQVLDPNDFEWIDGKQRTYTNWLAGEPNAGGCVRMNETGQWTDRPCADAASVFLPLCERP